MTNVLNLDEDWQARRTVVECNQHMWTNQLACDVTFITGQEETRIGAHKYVLGSRSSVFYAMFYGPLSRNTGSEVTVPEMTAEQFKGLMQFLYTEDVKVDLGNVLSLLYGAKKYAVQNLIDKCLNTLKKNMVPENVCTVMENAHIFGNDNLKSRCFNLIIQDTEKVLLATDLAELCNECLISIVKDDSIPVAEDLVFQAVLRFAKDKCVRNALEESPDNMRNMVADVIPHVRFPLMNAEYFSDHVEPTGLLTEKQSLQLFRYFFKKAKNPDDCADFNTKKRRFLFTVQRFKDVVSGWGYKRDKCDAISFTCSEDIIIKGVQVYGSNQGQGNMEVAVHLKQEPYKAIVAIKHALVETDGKQKIYNIFFDNPVNIKKTKKYTFTLIVKGPTTYYGTGGEAESVRENVKFTFEKSELSTNNTSPERGQIPGIIYELHVLSPLPDETVDTPHAASG